VTATTTSSKLHFGRSSTSWKAYQIYFPMDLESPTYLFGVNRNRRFTTESFSAHSAASPYFGPMGRIKLSPIRMRPRVGIRPWHPCGHSPTSLYPLAAAKNMRVFVRCKFSFCYFLVGTRADPAARPLVFRTSPYLRFSLKSSITSCIFRICSTYSS
jgi:hypothetical protein